MTPAQITLLEQGLTSLGTPPSTIDPTNFDARGDALLSEGLPRMVAELTAVLPLIPAAVVEATQAAALATSNGAKQVVLCGEQVALAATQAVNANKASLAALALANYKGVWASLGGAINTPASVAHAGEFWILVSYLPNVAASMPSPTNPAWLRIVGVTADGAGANGTWGISITGKAATAGAADTAVNATNATTAVTQAQSDNDTSIATTAFVKQAISAIPQSSSGVPTNGTGANGTWGISILGKAATAGAADTATNATNATTAVTQAQSDNDTSIATTAFVKQAISAISVSGSGVPADGTGANGIWGISITGSATTADTVSGIVDASIHGLTVGQGSGGNVGGNTALGANALYNNMASGNYNTAVGHGVLFGNTTGFKNTAAGYRALFMNNVGSSNTAIGIHALYGNTSGDCNTALGQGSLNTNLGGSSNTGIGFGALNLAVSNSENTAVGRSALESNAVFSNSSGLGAFAQVTGANQVQLGNSSTTTYVYGTVQNRSDARDKAQVRDTVLGTAFITALRPVDYKWDMRDDYRPTRPETVHLTAPHAEDFTDEAAFDAALADYTALDTAQKATMAAWLEAVKQDNLVHDGTHTRGRFHHGFIAQEVQALIKSTGQDFGGFQDHGRGGGHDVLSIGYDELIAPLIKCVQELVERIKVLEGK